jgi:hypothetical protein
MRAHHVSLVAHDHGDAGWHDGPGRREHVTKQGTAGDRVQDLRQGRFHPGSLTGSQNGDVGIRHSYYWSYNRFLVVLYRQVDLSR